MKVLELHTKIRKKEEGSTYFHMYKSEKPEALEKIIY